MSRQFYTADETADIILSDIEARLNQISEIISDTESLSGKKIIQHLLPKMKILKQQIHRFTHKVKTHLTRLG